MYFPFCPLPFYDFIYLKCFFVVFVIRERVVGSRPISDSRLFGFFGFIYLPFCAF